MQQSRSTQRRGSPLKPLTTLLVVAVAIAVFVSPVAAAQPAHITYTWTGSVELDGLCSFPVINDINLTIDETTFFDGSGAPAKWEQHAVQQDTFRANGKTLVGLPYTYNMHMLFDSSGNATRFFSTGVIEKVTLPDGSLFISAGWIDWLSHPYPSIVLWPDRGHSGDMDAFCAALS